MEKNKIIELEDIKSPLDIKGYNFRELELLGYSIRDFLIENISKTGGHLSSNLGIVEITLALHKVFETPKDKIIWDVGHQSYVHKILTGRAKDFKTLRQWQGLSGFPKRDENQHDFFDTGHASNSISVATGMAIARDKAKEDSNIIAVIGDGALTGGLAFEGLNNLGHLGTKAIIVLNDNEMSISKNTGSISQHLYKLRMSKGYLNFKKNIKNSVTKVPVFGKSLFNSMEQFRNHIKYAVLDDLIFEQLGLKYIGPLDGHNVEEMASAFEMAKNMDHPVIIHAITKKGKGYINSEMKPNKFHGVSPFDPTTGNAIKKGSNKSYSDIFGDKMIEIAKENEKVSVISAAMIEGTGLNEFANLYPDKIFDVGIAEGHAVSFAGGLAASGQKPVVAIYSTFLQRAYDHIIIDVCMQNLPVVFAIDRAGIVGNDGETHHGVFDLSYLTNIPNMTVLSPADKIELQMMLDYATKLNKPCSIRYPRGKAEDFSEIYNGNYGIITENKLIKSGKDITILATGKMVKSSLDAIKILEDRGVSVELINVRQIKPLALTHILESVQKTGKLVTIEDNALLGGFGEMVENSLRKENIEYKSLNLGWEDSFVPQGDTDILFKEFRLDSDSIAERVREFFEK